MHKDFHGLRALHAFIKVFRASFEAANSCEWVGASNKDGFVYFRNPSLIIDDLSMYVINEVVCMEYKNDIPMHVL